MSELYKEWTPDVEYACVSSQTAGVIGGIGCFNSDSLAALAEKAVHLYGDGRNVSVASLAYLGTVIGQLTHPHS